MKRIETIDGLRGFSLIGILMANMLIFQYGMFGKDSIDKFSLSTIDSSAYIWLKIFVESSFMPIFMFLFGYSMVLLRNKLESRGQKVKRHLARRFFLLMLFGALHAAFIWEGDILLAYGLIGFLALAFVNRKKKTILIWAIVFFTLTGLLSLGEVELTSEDIAIMNNYVEKETIIYSGGSYGEVLEFRNSGELPFNLPDYMYVVMLLMAPIITCPILLFGMYAAKSGWFTNPNVERKMYLRWAIILLPVGIFLKTISQLFPDFSPGEGLYIIGAPLLSVGYIFLFSLFYTNGAPKLFFYFEKVGKLSLTNYLVQSMICTTIFYGYGLGLFGKMGVFYGILLAILIYTMQFIISHYYLKIWRMGPFEKVLRTFTYLSWNGRVKTKVNNGKDNQFKAV
ncbi:DUF418 domain-containing protein [Ornithinibacillus scapharcae]|uniref:DUF418 domain-containing protein n=1 Tax=Ornithinibacillus scapharcae TaxID=1147159 RepID=UPI000225AD77|nr:DUF418 domain-containing protein [Ornithinibacillus scapharcae]